MTPYYYPQSYNLYQAQSGIIHVQSENEARMYRVAPGGSVTFIDDNAPYCYTKTAGFSQFDAPVFRKFRLVEEPLADAQNSPCTVQTSTTPDYTANDYKGQIEALTARIEALESKISKEAQYESIERRQAAKHNADASASEG